jgi:hypothetical protein
MNKKHVFAPSAWRLGGAVRRAATMLLVMMLTAMTAWAQQALTLGENHLNLPGVSGSTVAYDYTFTPPEDGTYRIWANETNWEGYVEVMVINGWQEVFSSEQGQGQFDCQGELSAYQYRVTFMVTQLGGDITVHIEKVDNSTPEPTALSVGDNTVAFVEGNTVTHTFTPAESGSYRFYSTSDYNTQITIVDGGNEIATDEDSGNDFNFDCTTTLTGGTTYTLILYCHNATGDATVTIEKVNNPTPPTPTVLSVGDNTVAFVADNTVSHTFTPTVSGSYHFYSTGDFNAKITIKDRGQVVASDDDSGTEFNFDCTTTLISGTTYTLDFYSYSSSGNATVTIEKIADDHLYLGTNIVNFQNRQTTTLNFTTDNVGGDYHFYSTGSSVNPEITIRRASNNALVATDDNSGTGDNFDCIAPLDYSSNYKVELYSSYGSGDMTIIVEKVPTPDPITVYFLCTESDWTPLYIRYFDLSNTDGVKTMANLGNNVWVADIPYYSARFWLSKDNSYNVETRTVFFSTNATTYPRDAFKQNSGTETFGKYFVGSYDPFLFLADNASNATAITDAATNGGRYDVTLQGRTLFKDGDWNTLCLPFDLDIADSPLDGDGVDVRTLSTSGFSGGTLTLTFTNAGAVTEMEAGKPYIIKWNNTGQHLTENDLVFTGVTVSSTAADVSTEWVNFCGTYSPEFIYEDGTEKHNLYLGDDNKLYYPTATDFKVKSFRGWFMLKKGLTAGEPAGVRAFNLSFGDGSEETIISPAEIKEIAEKAAAWYTLSGVKVDGVGAGPVPARLRKGLYIVNGKKVLVRDKR